MADFNITPELKEFLLSSPVARDLQEYLRQYLQLEHANLLAATEHSDIENIRKKSGICIGVGRVMQLLRQPEKRHTFTNHLY